MIQPSSIHAVFTAREMRFFQHFLTSTSHPLPLGNDCIWLKEIPQLAHEYQYLMHGILALGASEFQRTNSEKHAEHEMLEHRGRSIEGLNKALDDADASWTVSGFPDAVLATCYALIFQSYHITGGTQDYEIFVRGTAIVTEKIRDSKSKTHLNVTQDWPQERLAAGLEEIQSKMSDFSLIEQGLQALERASLMEMTTDVVHWKAMHDTFVAFRKSPIQGYRISMLSFGKWYDLANGLLQALSDPENTSAVVLLAIFSAANMVLINLLVPLQVWPSGSTDNMPSKTLRQLSEWLEAVEHTLPDSMSQYLDWPKTIMEMISTYISHEAATTIDSNLDTKIDMLLNRKTKAHMILGDIVGLSSELTSWFETFLCRRTRLSGSKNKQATNLTDG